MAPTPASEDNVVIDWWCPACDQSIQKPISYFVAERCHCPSCGAVLNMEKLRLRLAKAERKPARRR